jgi:LytS/YehU family sensor histidine kinase
MESYMKIQLHDPFFTIAGLSVGLLGTLFGLHMSSAIESTPSLMGGVTAVWCAVSASIIGGRINQGSAS